MKFFAQVASTEAHVTALQGLRDGSITLNGLTIDTDLGWELLEGLVLNGAATSDDIADMLANDNTASGAQAAARAHATFATPDAKLRALASLIDVDDKPNLIVRNTALGYQHVNDASVLEPAIDRYFSSLNGLWKSRSYAIAEALVVGLYPAPLASPALVDATQAWLETNHDIPALRRLMVENLAGVERALQAQEADRR